MRHKGQISGLASPFLERYRMNMIKKYASGGTVLDFGCGTGRLAGVINYDKYIGVDIDPENIHAARERYLNKQNIFFFTNKEFEYYQGRFDFVILSAVIEHFDNPQQECKNLVNLLNEHGRMIVTTPSGIGNNILTLGSRFGIFSKDAIKEHKFIFSRTDFIQLAIFLNLRIKIYQTFECGMNQLVVFSK